MEMKGSFAYHLPAWQLPALPGEETLWGMAVKWKLGLPDFTALFCCVLCSGEDTLPACPVSALFSLPNSPSW